MPNGEMIQDAPGGKENEAKQMILGGIRSKDPKEQDGFEPRLVEVTPEGEIKIDIRGNKHPIRITSSRFGTGDTVIYTAKTKWRDVSAVIANNSNATSTYQIHHIPSGGSAGDDNVLIADRSTDAGDIDIFTGLSLDSGEIISGLGSVNNAITVTLYGVPE